MTDYRNTNFTSGFGLHPFSRGDDEADDLLGEGLDAWEPDDDLPLAPLPLDPPQRHSLAQAVEAGLGAGGCDTTLRRAEAWARREEVPWASLRRALEDRGGFCDCEVLMNVLQPPG